MLEFFHSGGPVMYPLAVCSLVALAIIIERAINLRASRILSPTIVERVTGLAEGGRLDRAAAVCRERPGIYTNIVLAGLEFALRGEREQAAKEAIEDAGRHETARLNRYLGTLGTIVGISPLLGLLGTVLGMIDVFTTIAASGAGEAAQLSGGISQALISTATGLLIAIPSLVAHNFFHEKAQVLITDLERESLRVLRGLFLAPDAAEWGKAEEAVVAVEPTPLERLPSAYVQVSWRDRPRAAIGEVRVRAAAGEGGGLAVRLEWTALRPSRSISVMRDP